MKLLRLLIKGYVWIQYVLRFKKLPKRIELTTTYGVVRINGELFVYDKLKLNVEAEIFKMQYGDIDDYEID